MGKTSIEWTDRTWSPIRYRVRRDAPSIARGKGYTSLVNIAEKMAGRVGQHCEHVSPGCENCYSGTMQARCLPVNGTGLPFDRRSRNLMEPFIDEQVLLEPLNWRKPQKVFVENQSDLFGEWVPDEMIDRVFAVMALVDRHTFQILTKRAQRMSKYFATHYAHGLKRFDEVRKHMRLMSSGMLPEVDWPLPNVWLGVSVEDQQRADERIPDLLATPAAVRFLSVEPLLGPIDLNVSRTLNSAEEISAEDDACGPPLGGDPGIDWVIVGGESGRGARPMHPAWARSIRDQCQAAGVPLFFKQWGGWGPFGEASVGHDNALVKCGKKAAGRLLDGRYWSEFPKEEAR